MAECTYPKCKKCEFDYCIKDVNKKTVRKRDRSEYYKAYYKSHKKEKSEYYISKAQYLSRVQVTSSIKRLQKMIGKVNTELIIQELNQLEVFYDKGKE